MAEKKNEACRIVSEALHLDSKGFEELSYNKYLDGIDKLCSYLKEDFSFSDFKTKTKSKKETLQVLSIIKDSSERLIKLISKLPDQTDNNCHSNSSENAILSNSLINENPHQSDHIPIPKLLSNGRARPILTPIEKARRDNGLIYRDFQARCQLVKDSNKRASMYLELHRRLNENIMVARVKEAAVRQQQIEKEKGILELAAKKLALKEGVFNHVSNNTKEWEKLLLYAQILQYEELEDWPKRERLKLKKDPLNETLISDVLKNTLCVSSHPLSLWMCKCQVHLSDRLQYVLNQNLHLEKLLPTTEQNEIVPLLAPNSTSAECSSSTDNSCNSVSTVLPLNKMWLEGDVLTLFDPLLNKNYHLCSLQSGNPSLDLSSTDLLRNEMEDIIHETSEAIETLVHMLCATYEVENDEGQDVCYHVVENYFFNPIWSHIIQLFRIVNCENEKQMSNVIQNSESAKPLEISVPSYYDLQSCAPEIVNRFHRVLVLNTPLAKLQQLVFIAQAICNPKYTTGKPLGADELIGIMCFMLIKSGIPQLASEFEAIEQLVPHRYLMGEEGYALTTHRTALKYLLSQEV